ncbi:MAG: hypothetical protein IPP61_16800 [Cytophagaceae bacterium]|nr:hypothetical protein [Cytophagaceae bacterium]MBL0303990.1 hypothetical protein [Cytophagaceae bacterium]MBL0326802.1 hypothetical protein [Cytophagaceae bacterium]
MYRVLTFIAIIICTTSCFKNSNQDTDKLINLVSELKAKVDSLQYNSLKKRDNKYLNIENPNGRIYGHCLVSNDNSEITILYDRIPYQDRKYQFVMYFSVFNRPFHYTYHSEVNLDDSEIHFTTADSGQKDAGSTIYRENTETVRVNKKFKIVKLANGYNEIKIPISFFDWKLPERVWIYDWKTNDN